MKISKSNIVESLRRAVRDLEKGKELEGKELIPLISALTEIEIEEGGPYTLRQETNTENADFGLNLLIAYFLLFCEVKLPKLDEFLNSRQKNASSKILTKAELNYFTEKWQKMVAQEQKEEDLPKEVQYTKEEKQILNKIIKIAEKRFKNLSPELRAFAEKCVDKMLKRSLDKQIPFMAFYTKQVLGKKGSKISDELVAELGLANIFFWASSIIYDDFWDEDEDADLHILPTANLFARHYVDFFSSLFPKETKFREFFHKLMDNTDEANTWETIHCRAEVHGSRFIIPKKLPEYGDYEFKFRPASGHILGSVALLVQLKYKIDSKEVKNFISYFKNYLIAKQINDDLHDWEEDLRKGHLSTVVVPLLQDYQEKYKDKKEINIDEEILDLKEVFWFKTLATITKRAIKHTEASRKALKSIAILEDISPLEKIINITENPAKKALNEQQKSTYFVDIYNK